MSSLGKWLLRILAVIIALSSAGELLKAVSALFHSGEPAGIFIPPAVALALAALGLWYWSGADDRVRQAEKRKYDQIEREVITFFDSVNSNGSFPPVSSSRVISHADNPVLAACKASFMEITTDQARNYLGARIRIGGLPVYIGQSRATGRKKLSEVAVGELALTPKGLVFSGTQRSVDVDLNHIIAIDIALDAITISVKGRQKPYIFIVPNGFLWGMLAKNLTQIALEGRSLPSGTKLQLM